ncbi:hypothetical protein A3Q56_00838 [Intoshia linei]|uniref:Uncharacterized protein n=1 Tax=Intoshia linei TaxID=1819745 RepID=A0A177BAW1_9BILA|nr:hypothetical protein A3Q56_00838 [Intoshia linei]
MKNIDDKEYSKLDVNPNSTVGLNSSHLTSSKSVKNKFQCDQNNLGSIIKKYITVSTDKFYTATALDIELHDNNFVREYYHSKACLS